jgi:hypothetical protein
MAAPGNRSGDADGVTQALVAEKAEDGEHVNE